MGSMPVIKSSREIDAVFRASRKASLPLLVLLVREIPAYAPPRGRVAVVAGKRLGGAVARNRAKRVLREAARRAGAPWTGVDAVLIARPGTGSAAPHELDHSLATALSRLGLGA